MLIVDSGVYIAVFFLPQVRQIHVGKLGRLRFRRGLYFYVGSAQKNLSARIERHRLKEKVLRWHIDYFSVWAKMLGVIIVLGRREKECELAKELASILELAAIGFGSSDCTCDGHLFYAPELP